MTGAFFYRMLKLGKIAKMIIAMDIILHPNVPKRTELIWIGLDHRP